jgi:alkylated DNA nucleotide flippase Atl1
MKALLSAVLVALLANACAAASVAPKPDVLILMPDQMRGDCLSLLGPPAVRTPHLDELARQGVLFRRAYSTCPSCIPARHSLLTGLFPATSGVVGFAGRPITYPTLPKMLGDSGYASILVGRCMHQVTDGHSKYIWRPIDGTEQLFDLDKDIREEHDLAKDPVHRTLLEQCRARLVSLLVDRPEGFSDGSKLIAGRPYPPLQARRTKN